MNGDEQHTTLPRSESPTCAQGPAPVGPSAGEARVAARGFSERQPEPPRHTWQRLPAALECGESRSGHSCSWDRRPWGGAAHGPAGVAGVRSATRLRSPLVLFMVWEDEGIFCSCLRSLVMNYLRYVHGNQYFMK